MKTRIIKVVSCFVLLLTIAFGFGQVTFGWDGLNTLKPYTPEMVEMRAVWVATVSNIDIARQKNTTEAGINEWKANYLKVLDDAEARNLNTIIFQIRPNNDAFYPSKYNPWSEFLAGYGVDPGWDPLEWMLEVTHERGMEYHAWLNPYRTSVGTLGFDYKVADGATGSSYIVDYDQTKLDEYKTEYFGKLKNSAFVNGKTYENPIFGNNVNYDVVLGAEDKFVLNPASEKVLEHLNNTITEIVENYDIDGIHFDDYFYPNDTTYKGDKAEYKGYTFSTEPYRDMQDYTGYLNSGGTLSIYNWRRQNVDTLIKNLSEIIREYNKTKDVKCAFGISPCAGYAPDESCTAFDRGVVGGMGNNCNDYYAYSDLFADTKKWAVEGWIDYITPQCYTNLDTNYAKYVSWWSNALKGTDTRLYIGQGIYKVKEWGDKLEMLKQVRYNQSYGYNVDGYFFYNYKSMLTGDNYSSIKALSDGIWKRNTLTPIYNAYDYKDTVTGNIKINSIVETTTNSLVVKFEGLDDAKAYVIEEYENSVSEIDFSDNKYVNICYGKDNQFEFVPTSGKKYVLAPVAQNNVVQNNYVEIDLNAVVKNNVPEVSIEQIAQQVLKKSELEVKININDTDNTTFAYQIFISIDGDEFNLLQSGNVDKLSFTYVWKTYLIAQENIRFKVIVNDGKDEAEFISNSFDVVDSLEKKFKITYNLDGGKLGTNAPSEYKEGVGIAKLPTPTKEGYTFAGWTIDGESVSRISPTQSGDVVLVATWNKIAKKKGCSKSAAEIMVATLSITSLSILILRKNKRG